MRYFRLLVFTAIFTLFHHVVSAQHVLKGTVVDTLGKPLIGASVTIKGASKGVSSDVDGAFVLEVPDSHTIITISYNGYMPLVAKVGDERERTFVLKIDVLQGQMDEVVTVGYGTQKKISVTGALTSVSVEQLQRSATPSLSNTLGGALPGIVTRQSSGEPGYDQASVYIRGLGTWVNRSPLILVDGVERDMNNINMQEIESFSILKDASATAVYGVRGANGVILITTKHGTRGRPKVTLRTENANLHNLRLPEFINSYEYATLINESLTNSGQNIRYSDEELQKFKDGSDPYFYPNVNWVDSIFRKNTFQSISNLSVNGGNDFIRYYLNIGYTDQSGIYKESNLNNYNTNSRMKRYNYRSNVDVNLSKSLSLNLGVGGIIQVGHYPGRSQPDIWDALMKTPPLAFPMRNPDGSPGGITAYLGSNPWAMVTQSGYSRQDRSTTQANASAKWDLSSLVTKGLSVKGMFAFDRYAVTYTDRVKTFEVKQYTGTDPVTGEDLYTVLREEEAMGYSTSNTANVAAYGEVSINYNRTFSKHIVSGMLVGNRREYVDLTAGSSVYNIPYRRQGLAGRATYNYDNRYLLEINAGYNGSENFPKGNRYGLFPSVSGGWIISNEKFWNVEAINQLKIRGSYGLVGNDDVGGGRFLYLTTINKSATGFRFGQAQTYVAGFAESTTGTTNITWEKSKKLNIGLDLALLNNALSIQADAFDERRYDILIQRQSVPSYLGYLSTAVPYGNLGKVHNKGIEGLVEYKKQATNGMFYSLRGSFSYAHNVITANDRAQPVYDYQDELNWPIDQPYGYVALGLFKDQEDVDNSPTQELASSVNPGDIKYKDLNNDGVINAYDETYIGHSRTPEIMYGFGGTIGYKNFDFSIYFTGAEKTSYFYNSSNFWIFNQGAASWNVFKEFYDNRWSESNPDGWYPRIINGNSPNNYVTSTYWMKNGAYLRIKNAEIGYNIPNMLLKKWKINGFRIFANGINFYTWDHLKIIDPESENGSLDYPLQSSYNFGLQINF
ncbi:MAG: TonB-dependent receptor [Niabella sp.]